VTIELEVRCLNSVESRIRGRLKTANVAKKVAGNQI